MLSRDIENRMVVGDYCPDEPAIYPCEGCGVMLAEGECFPAESGDLCEQCFSAEDEE